MRPCVMRSLSAPLLVVLAVCSGNVYSAGRDVRPKESFTSVDFTACRRPALPNPHPVEILPRDLGRTLHGIWVGGRTLREGTAPQANYLLAFDADGRESIFLEERGESIRENAFARQFPPPASSAPRLVYFYCGDATLAAFRDEFVKVADEPRLDAVAQVLGVPVGGMPLGQAWETLRQAGYFTRPREALLNAAFHTLSLLPARRPKDRTARIRLDLAGQLRGSPAKLTEGQPVASLEGGVFEGVAVSGGQTLPAGNYAIATAEYAVACFGVAQAEPQQLTAAGTMSALPPLTNFRYTKVLLGPLPALP